MRPSDRLHSVQQAFIDHDAFQCGYCTPGQICSAVDMINEGHVKSEVDIRELMSGNICRCGSYPHIVEAIQSVINTHQPLTLQDQARAGRPSSLESDQKSVVEWVKTGTHGTRDIAERIEEK